MNDELTRATHAIHTYAFGMDTADWDLATRVLGDSVEIDYSAVGFQRGTQARTEVAAFLKGLLGKPDLRVHTAIAQVLADPSRPGEFVAYYTVRHHRGPMGSARAFVVHGWYRFRMAQGAIAALAIEVSAIEGDPSVLA